MSEYAQGRGYLGGAHIAAIMGLSTFSTPLDAYLEICGELPREACEAREEFFWRRKALEPFANACFERATGLKIIRSNHRFTHPDFDYFKAEIDAETEDVLAIDNCEHKTVRAEMAKDWGDPENGEEPPIYVTAQAMWGLGITNRPLCRVHALIGLDESRIYHVLRNPDVIDILFTRAHAFWNNHVVPRRPPQPVNESDLLRLFPRDTGAEVECTPEVLKAWTLAADAKDRLKVVQNEVDRHTLALKMHMRSATVLTSRGKCIASWKANSAGSRVFKLY